MTSHEYEVIIYWSRQDGAFVAEVPELPTCVAHGDSQLAALRNVNQAMDLWLDTAREFGDPIPEPKGRTLYACLTQPEASLPEIPMGQWMIEKVPRGTSLEIPDRHAESHRKIPFADWDDSDWGDESAPSSSTQTSCSS